MAIPPEPRELPVACTLGPADGRERVLRWQRLIAATDPVFERSPTNLTVRFAERPGVLAELESLAGAERECCAFLDWNVSADGAPTLTITADHAEDLDATACQFGS